MIKVEVKQSLSWFKGGKEAEDLIERFAFRTNLKTEDSNYNPNKKFLVYTTNKRSNVIDFKNRIRRSSKLKDNNVEITLIEKL